MYLLDAHKGKASCMLHRLSREVYEGDDQILKARVE